MNRLVRLWKSLLANHESIYFITIKPIAKLKNIYIKNKKDSDKDCKIAFHPSTIQGNRFFVVCYERFQTKCSCFFISS